MTQIYEIDKHSVWTGKSRSLNRGEGRTAHWTIIPPPTVPQGKIAQLRGCKWVLLDSLPESDVSRTLETLKSRKLREINDAYTAAAEPLVKEYPEVETKGWDQQKADSEAYLAWYDTQEGEPPVLMVLDNILAGRNGDDGTETLHELCLAVRRNAEAFAQFQVLTGKRQRLAKQARAAETLEAVEAIQW